MQIHNKGIAGIQLGGQSLPVDHSYLVSDNGVCTALINPGRKLYRLAVVCLVCPATTASPRAGVGSVGLLCALSFSSYY